MIRWAALCLLVNAALCAQASPFTGVWRTSEGVFYQFNADGTGGAADTADGPFEDGFSFLTWSGTGITPGYPRQNTLALVFSSGGGLSGAVVDVYAYTVSGGTISAKTQDGKALVLTRVSGLPAPLALKTHPLLGEWEAVWNGQNHSGALGTWSFLYRADGTVKTYHHRLHQFENAYLVRGNLLVIIGEWRFHPLLPVNTALITALDGGRLRVTESNGVSWDYTRKNKARWK